METQVAPEDQLRNRFRGFYPVIVDVETAGLCSQTDALLEIGAYFVRMTPTGMLETEEHFHTHVMPFEGANLDKEALEFNGIDPFNPLRGAVDAKTAISSFFKAVDKKRKKSGCVRAVMVAHNAMFDFGFINAAARRSNITKSPFHPFTAFDTATLAGFAYGQTVLAKACAAAGVEYNTEEAHGALYDSKVEAELFCRMVNRYRVVGGWPLRYE